MRSIQSLVAAGCLLLTLSSSAGSRADDVPFRRGDVDANGRRNVADAVALLRGLFHDGASLACLDAADADDNGEVAVADAIYLLNAIFRRGPRPPQPLAKCGLDPTADALTCVSFPICSDGGSSL
jgi:hypothetical protein